MNSCHYLIAGASHAGLEAAATIRQFDADTPITMINRDSRLPYSPTILPYILSGKSDPQKVTLRDHDWFKQQKIDLVCGDPIGAIDTSAQQVTLESGQQWRYEKLLLATGADPQIPPIPGLGDCSFHTLRTMDQAIALRQQAASARTALVLGAGLIGMHASENLSRAGLEVSLVERCDQVLPGYFDAQASGMIRDIFTRNGVQLLLGRELAGIVPAGKGCHATLDDGMQLEADLLLVAAGVRPRLEYLAGSGVDHDNGILVDEWMHTSAPNIWAAGDVAQAKDFYADGQVMTSILPDALVQGRIAGQAMAGDTRASGYCGGIPLNSYHFFGNQAISVGRCMPLNGETESITADPDRPGYRKILLKGKHLQGYSCINEAVDAGILWHLIQRRVDLEPVLDRFLQRPLETARTLMSNCWR